MRKFLFALCASGLLCLGASGPAGATVSSQFYWTIDQYPHYATVYLYSGEEAQVSFSDGASVLATRTLPGGQITSYPASDLGFSAPSFYYMEIITDKPVMAFVENEVTDDNNIRPPESLSNVYYFPRGYSGAHDDILALHSAGPANITITGYLGSTPISRSLTINGFQTFDVAPLFNSTGGYGIKLQSDRQIAAAILDQASTGGGGFPEGLWWGESALTTLHSDYSRIVYYQQTIGLYTESANNFTFYDEAANIVGSYLPIGPQSLYLSFSALGYPVSPGVPIFTRATGTSPFGANFYPTPQETVDGAVYFGADSTNATLGVQSESSAQVTVANHMTGQSVTLPVSADSFVARDLSDLSIFSSGPFIAHVTASAPVYQEVRMDVAPGTLSSAYETRLQQYAPAFVTEPDIEVTPGSVNFLNTEVGLASAPESVNVSNVGTAPLDLGMVLLSDTTNFTKRADTCSSQTLEPSDICAIEMAFTPQASGDFSATLTIPSNDPDENPVIVDLSGKGVIATRYQERNPSITYSKGCWRRYRHALFSGRFAKIGKKAGCTATFTFIGEKVDFISARARLFGEARIYVDAVYEATIDLYSPTIQPQQAVFSKSFPAGGSHIVTIEITGTKNPFSKSYYVPIDAFDVTS